MKTLIEKTSDKLVKAFLKNKIISPIPSKFTKKIDEAQKLRKLCENKIKEPIIGFKAAGTGIPKLPFLNSQLQLLHQYQILIASRLNCYIDRHVHDLHRHHCRHLHKHR